MPGDFPDELSDVPVTIHDFTSGDPIARGRASLRFVEHTDRLRVMRFRFAGEFTPETPADQAALERALVSGFSAGAVGHKLQVEHGGRTLALPSYSAGVVTFSQNDCWRMDWSTVP